MVFDPFKNLGVLVSGIVVDDHMHRLLLGHLGINDVEEADELLMAMALHTLADDLAFQHIKRCEQRRDAMTLVVVCDGAGTSLLHRQPRLGAVQRLDLAFLIDRENDGVVGRVDVEADDLFELGRKLGIVGQLEPADQMRPQAMSTPDPLHRTDADPSGFRHRRAGPMAGGRRRSCQGQGHNAFGYLWAQWWNARGTSLVAPKPRYAFFAKPFLPAPDHRLGLAGGAHDVGSAMTIGRQKHNLRPPNVCFCGLLRLAATVSSSLRSAALNRMLVRSCILQTRTRESTRECPSESKCQIWSTRWRTGGDGPQRRTWPLETPGL